MAKKDDEKIEEPEEKDIESDEEAEASEGAEVPTESVGKEEEKKSLFEDEPEEAAETEPKKKSVADIVRGDSSDSNDEDEEADEPEEDIEDESNSAEASNDAKAMQDKSLDEEDEEDTNGDSEEAEEDGKVKTEEEIEEKADEDFQAGIPSEEKKSKKVKKTKKKKGLLKKVFLVALIIFVLLLGAFAGVQIYNRLNKEEEPKAEAQTEVQPQEEAKPVEDKVVYVTAEDGLNLREEGSDAGKLIVTMPYGTKLTVLDEGGDWYQVDYNGQEGWCAKLYTSEEKPAAAWKTYTGSGFMTTAPKFSIKYPADWTLTEGYRIRKTDDGKKYMIALGEGGHGMTEGSGITIVSKKVTYNGLPATQTTAKKNGVIFFISVQFKKGDDTTQMEMNLPTGYDETYIDTFDQMLETFKYL